ncbi:hypothetical protein V6N11_084032 [Hibiscus sabdariffa]|uniref:Uncharacterized protein n=1 Tax=Hibiscus sabdariffa TaxID=183260 RepID=A0ABR2QD70_9ROSI
MREFTEEVGKELLKGFKAIMDGVVDKFLIDFRNDLNVVQERVTSGFDQKRDELSESSLVTDCVEPNDQVLSTVVSNVEFSDI